MWNNNVEAALFNSVTVLLLLSAMSKDIQDWMSLLCQGDEGVSNVFLLSHDSWNNEEEENNKTPRPSKCSSGEPTSQRVSG